jgi:hypothetical protein
MHSILFGGNKIYAKKVKLQNQLFALDSLARFFPERLLE